MDNAAATVWFEAHRDQLLAGWMELLRFPSVSTDPTCDNDSNACAAWLCGQLEALGFAATVRTTPTHPVVYAERAGSPDLPTVLFYGHYDVQPADPLELWESPPFDPCIRNDRVYGRGAQDNKGQIWYVINALGALIEQESLHAPVKIVIEGGEESGSTGLAAMLPEWTPELAADVLLVADTGTVPSGAPTIIMGLRGMLHLTVSLQGPDHDLHSGLHGGLTPNPATELARLIDTLFTADRAVAVEGFYNGVTEPGEAERAAANAPGFDHEEYRALTGGASATGGESAYSPAERLGFRPTIDVNGLSSGYAGPGVKTILPASATVKLTARLVPGQDPEPCLTSIIQHLHTHAPNDLTLRIDEQGIGGRGLTLSMESPYVEMAREVLASQHAQEPVLRWEGASIPIVAALQQASGATPLLVGFGHEEDNIHAPNESFSLTQFRSGFLYTCGILSRLSQGQ